jgi:hypothetical protein
MLLRFTTCAPSNDALGLHADAIIIIDEDHVVIAGHRGVAEDYILPEMLTTVPPTGIEAGH